MELTRSVAALPRVIWRESSPSTNADLRDLVQSGNAGDLPHGTVLATADQTAGRGRLGRGWDMPPHTAVAVSVLIRGFGGAAAKPGGSAGYGSAGYGTAGYGTAAGRDAAASELSVGWLPLIAGSAVARALQPHFDEGLRVGVKWPNDVHVRDEEDAMAGRPGRKLCGILCEMLPMHVTDMGHGNAAADSTIVVGMGINLLIDEMDLPTDRATSLLAAGADVGGALSLADPAGADLADRVIERTVSELLRLSALAAVEPGAVRAGVLRHSLTLGSEVRVHLPGGQIVDGRARTLADDGSLIVDLPTGGELTVSAGDVEHLR